jgi:type IX secretion system PorP/SprF family membrane protein
MKKIIAIYIVCCFAWSLANAQDVIFTQFYTTPMQLNPAFAGNTLAPRIGVNYRDQWHNVSKAYTTFTASYDQFIDGFNSGIGLSILSDKAGGGIYQKNNATVSYAYRLRIPRAKMNVKFGIEAGLGQTNVDWNKLVFLDMIDPVKGYVSGAATQEVAPLSFNKSYFDVSTGFLVYSDHWYAGASFKHLNTPDQSILDNKAQLSDGLPILYSLQGGYEIVLSRGKRNSVASFVTPNILIAKQGPFTQINIGAQAGMGAVFAGLGFRHTIRNSDAVIVNLGVKKGVFKMGYSHDITVNGLLGSFGAHEISVVLNFDEMNNAKKPKYVDCFNFMR